MVWLSTRLVRFALLASATSLLSYAAPAFAQMPVTAPPDAAQPPAAVAPPDAAQPPSAVAPPDAVAPPEASSTPTELPPPPAAPPGAAMQPPSPNAPAPAKADRLVTRAPERAADDEAEDDEQSRPKRRWYGWQTLIADGASTALLIAAASQDHGGDSGAAALAWLGVLSYEFTPGIIHFVHRNPGRGFASFGLRLAMPVAGAVLGASLASGCNGFLCEAGGAAIGSLVGMSGAIAVDAAVFAYDDPKPSRYGRLTLTPVIAVLPGRAWVGVSGRL